jgi:hypothetical protein
LAIAEAGNTPGRRAFNEIMSQMIGEVGWLITTTAPSRTGDTPTVIDNPIPHRLS